MTKLFDFNHGRQLKVQIEQLTMFGPTSV